ncbi:MAG: hypothetical protein ACTSU5_22350, partial [Promethearchaeota archaeon]
AMHIVYHPKFKPGGYSSDPAADPGRLDYIVEEIESHRADGSWTVVEPEPATERDVLRAHTKSHVKRIKRNPELYEIALLAAGGAARAAELAWEGKPAFAVIRPPGHHASADSCWGFCFFNNMSVALLKIFEEKGVNRAFVLDFDLHTGDGNINILLDHEDHPDIHVNILNPSGGSEEAYLDTVRERLEKVGPVDIVAASAGFDQGVRDWGGLLSSGAYRELGNMLKEFAERNANGRRFAILEGGYFHADLGEHLAAFCEGFS